MNTQDYHRLNFKEDDPAIYRRRLEAFALANRFQRASNYFYVAHQIVQLNLVDQFKRFHVK